MKKKWMVRKAACLGECSGGQLWFYERCNDLSGLIALRKINRCLKMIKGLQNPGKNAKMEANQASLCLKGAGEVSAELKQQTPEQPPENLRTHFLVAGNALP